MTKNCALHLSPQALSVITNPRPEHGPRLRLLAWATLKTERGQTVLQHRLNSCVYPAQTTKVA